MPEVILVGSRQKKLEIPEGWVRVDPADTILAGDQYAHEAKCVWMDVARTDIGFKVNKQIVIRNVQL